MPRNIIVNHPHNLTVDWAQRVINQHRANTTVSKVAIAAVDVGTTTRVKLMVDHDDHTVPRSWFVKLPSLAWRARLITALPRLLPTEVRYYRDIATAVPVRQVPLLAGQSQLGRGSTLVLADVNELGATAGNPYDALSYEQAQLVVKELAQFHAYFWQTAAVHPHYQWLNSSVRQLEDMLGTALAVPLIKRGLRRTENLIPQPIHTAAISYARNRKQAMRFLSGNPKTLVHHDCHPGNLFWHEGLPGFLDWQLVRIGEGISDIAYFLATALDPQIRRQHEGDLLAYYYDSLTANGVSDISLEHLKQRYRAHLVYPFEAMVVTLAIGGMMALNTNLELIRRTVAAVEDHDAFTALPCFP